ncbi:MAG TPA: ATP-binding cassette domain-containing protein [Mucilaginibacter sp.]
MINIHSLQCHYGNRILSFLDWYIQQGEHWLVLGESGSGKTTLLHLLGGLLKPNAGEVVINGMPIYQLSEARLDRYRGQNIGMVFQRAHLIKSLNVFDNLLAAQSFAGIRPDKNRIRAVLGSLNIEDRQQSFPAELSQGQLQRVSIARAVINEPGIIMADEPTSSLDDKNAGLVIDLLIGQAEEYNSTLIIASHDKRVKDRIANTYLVSL